MAGQHRAPVEHKAGKRAATVVVGTAALMSVPGSNALAALPPGDVNEALDLIADCESDGRNVMNYINDATHTAGGYWQITNTTWRAYGGTEFAPTAIQATADQQRTVATRILAARPNGADWNESKSCWGPRFQAALAGQNVTDVHPGGPTATPPPAAAVTPAPAPTPQPPAASAEPGPGLTYTVRSGDVLHRIAAANGTTWRELARINNLGNPDRLMPGQVLRLGAGGAPAPSADHDHDHSGGDSVTIRPGDELREIAREHGMNVWDIAKINGIGDPDRIYPGQVLRLGGQGLTAGTLSNAGWGPQVYASVQDVAARFGISTVVTRVGHSPSKELAADFMTTNTATQDAIVRYVIDNRVRLGVDYVISRQRIYGAWTNWQAQAMENRGSPTANHMDHVHISYKPNFTYSPGAGAAAPAVDPAPVETVQPVQPVPDTRQVTVRRGDTLSTIAAREGVRGGWRALWEANRDTVRNPDRIREGAHLVLMTSDGTRNVFGALPSVP